MSGMGNQLNRRGLAFGTPLDFLRYPDQGALLADTVDVVGMGTA